jgi:hypothetical protein
MVRFRNHSLLRNFPGDSFGRGEAHSVSFSTNLCDLNGKNQAAGTCDVGAGVGSREREIGTVFVLVFATGLQIPDRQAGGS